MASMLSGAPADNRNRTAPRPEMVFLVLALICGAVLVALFPPFQGDDESEHFFRAYALAEFQVLPQAQGEAIGNVLPVSLTVAVSNAALERLMFHPREKFGLADLRRTLAVPLQPEIRAFCPMRAGAYPPASYLPQAIPMLLGRLAGARPLLLLYAGRLGNLACWIALVFLAIRIAPAFKWVFVLTALMPMPLALAASLSADPVANACSWVLVAHALHLRSDRTDRVQRKDLMAWAALLAVLAWSKVGYALLGLLFLLVPVRKFKPAVIRIGSRSWTLSPGLVRVLAFIGLCAVPLALAGLWGALIGTVVPVTTADWSAAAGTLLTHPLTFIQKALPCGLGYAMSLIGVLGWLDTRLPLLFYPVYALALLTAAVLDGHASLQLPARSKLLPGLVATIILIMIEALRQLGMPLPGLIHHSKVVGRYLIPAVLPTLLLLYPGRESRYRALLPRVLPVFLVGALGVTLWRVLARYYLP